MRQPPIDRRTALKSIGSVIAAPKVILSLGTVIGSHTAATSHATTLPKGRLTEAGATVYAKFDQLPITSVKAAGWLQRYLETMRTGLAGHAEETGYPFDTCGWVGPDRMPTRGESQGKELIPGKGHQPFWVGYEQVAYWTDGVLHLGYLLADKNLIAKARKQTDYVLNNPGTGGYLGPLHIECLWPQAVFFRSLMVEYSVTRDPAIVQAIHQHYLFGKGPQGRLRNEMNAEAMGWAYARTGDKRLIEMAEKSYLGLNELTPEDVKKSTEDADLLELRESNYSTSLTHLLSDQMPEMHSVTYAESVKIPAILYMYTGKELYLKAALNGFRKAEQYHMLIDGVPSASGQLAPGGIPFTRPNTHLNEKYPNAFHETCVTIDWTWSLGYMLQITGNAKWADDLERGVFNAGLGAITKDFGAFQYWPSPNQIIAAGSHPHVEYKAKQSPECCAGNIHRLMPNFTSRLWLSDGNGGLVAALYSPNTITAPVGKDGQMVTIEETTDYPFSEYIAFRLQADGNVAFPLWLRIPGWCVNPSVTINGKPVDMEMEPGTFVKFDREFSPGDVVRLHLPMKTRLSYWPEGGVGVERGPLVYSLLIKEKRRITGKDGRFPNFEMRAASPWNYALALDAENLDQAVEVVHKPMTDTPWDVGKAPIELHVPAYRVADWTEWVIDVPANKKGEHDRPIELTPRLPDPATLKERLADRPETVTLVPYGGTCLRLTIFPNAAKALAISGG